MPELRLVVLALQDRLVYAPTFEAALAALFGNAGTAPRRHPPHRGAGGAKRQRPRPGKRQPM